MSDLLLWLDVETTGLDPEKDPIIEIGMKVTTFHLTERLAQSTPVLPRNWEGRSDKRLDGYTRTLHGGNGLLDLLDMINESDAYSAMNVADRLRHTVVEPAIADGNNVYLAGSSVSFDRNMVNAQMPGLLRGVRHRIIDVSSMLEMALHLDNNLPGMPAKTTDHRVDNCLTDSIAVYRRFLPLFSGDPGRWGWDTIITPPQRRALDSTITSIRDHWHAGIIVDGINTKGLILGSGEHSGDGWTLSYRMSWGNHLATGTIGVDGATTIRTYTIQPDEHIPEQIGACDEW